MSLSKNADIPAFICTNPIVRPIIFCSVIIFHRIEFVEPVGTEPNTSVAVFNVFSNFIIDNTAQDCTQVTALNLYSSCTWWKS